MKAYDIIGYTADATVHCTECITVMGYETNGDDDEGNPVHPIFASNEGAEGEYCGICREKLME